MEVKQNLVLYLTSPTVPVIDAVQGDGARLMVCRLMDGAGAWAVPDSVRAGLSYTLPDKTDGFYDTLQDGVPAAVISGNQVSIVLDPVLTQYPGAVSMSLVLRDGAQQIATFPIRLRVAPVPGLVTAESLAPQKHGFDGKIYYGGPGGILIPLGLGSGVKVETQDDGSVALVSEGGSMGAEPAGAVYAHNKSASAHADIRQKFDGLLPREELQEALNDALAQAKESGEFDGAPGPAGPQGKPGAPGKDGVIALSGATVGQIAKITAVDENGVPTAWEPVDFPSGIDSEEVWEDVCDITTEEATTLLYHDLGARYKKLRIRFAYKFAQNTACQVWILGNVTSIPGNNSMCQIGVDGYGNKTNRTLMVEFSNERVTEKSYFRKNYTSGTFDMTVGEMSYSCGILTDPIPNQAPYVNGVHSLLIAGNTNAEFVAGAKLTVKGVRM